MRNKIIFELCLQKDWSNIRKKNFHERVVEQVKSGTCFLFHDGFLLALVNHCQYAKCSYI